MPSLVLGPQALDSYRRYTVGPIKGPDGNPLTDTVTLDGTESLACRLWRGEGSDAAATPSATWLDAAAGTITLAIAPEDLAGLAPGRYRIELLVTLSGEPLGVLPADAVIDLADAPGSTTVAGWLVTLAEVSDALGARFAARDDAQDLALAASGLVEAYCRRTFAQADLDELYDGPGRPLLLLRRPPVSALTAVWIDGEPLDLTQPDSCTVDPASGRLLRGTNLGDPRAAAAYTPGWFGPGYAMVYSVAWLGLGHTAWSAGWQNIRVQYTGGYATVPTPVKRATLIVMKWLADSTKATGLFSYERIGDYEYQIAPGQQPDLPFVARALLDLFVMPQMRA